MTQIHAPQVKSRKHSSTRNSPLQGKHSKFWRSTNFIYKILQIIVNQRDVLVKCLYLLSIFIFV